MLIVNFFNKNPCKKENYPVYDNDMLEQYFSIIAVNIYIVINFLFI